MKEALYAEAIWCSKEYEVTNPNPNYNPNPDCNANADLFNTASFNILITPSLVFSIKANPTLKYLDGDSGTRLLRDR